MKFLKRMAAFCAAAMLTGSAALAQEYDAQQAKSWMEQFAQALSQLAPSTIRADARSRAAGRVFAGI